MCQKIQPEIDNVYKWCSANRLRLNVDKSKILVIGSRSKLSKIDFNHSISLNHNPLKFATKWERIWEKGPIGNFFTNSIPEKLPF